MPSWWPEKGKKASPGLRRAGRAVTLLQSYEVIAITGPGDSPKKKKRGGERFAIQQGASMTRGRLKLRVRPCSSREKAVAGSAGGGARRKGRAGDRGGKNESAWRMKAERMVLLPKGKGDDLCFEPERSTKGKGAAVVSSEGVPPYPGEPLSCLAADGILG